MKGAAFYTLGCKLNQLETESIAEAFRKQGFEVIPWDAPGQDGAPALPKEIILIINTCTVTSRAEQKARHIIRKALRDHPLGIALVTGCYAQMEAGEIEALSGGNKRRVFVIPGEKKDALLDLPSFLKQNDGESLRDLTERWLSGKTGGGEGDSFRFRPADFSFHSRAFLKIEDGCDNRCAYCRVSIARGKSRSESAEEILSSLKALETRLYREAVLTGVNISQYGGKTGGGENGNLPFLLEYLLSGTRQIRLRLSSLEPETFTPEFFKAAGDERIRPHFHLSVQSGSPSVLERMGRRTSISRLEDHIRRLREIRDNPFISCDIIAGFPGETPKEFEETFGFCERAGFAWIHAFPFSRRPGTPAWDFKNRVSEREARARVGRLMELAAAGRKAYTKSWIGKETEFIPESRPGSSALTGGVTANYLKVFLKGAKSTPSGMVIRCRITGEAGADAGEKKFDAEARLL